MKKGQVTLNIWIAILGMVELWLAGYIFVFHYMCMDHAEHLHAAWLVWQGEVPYRDFFEHHNPLLWYLLAPLVAAFYNNALILYVSKALSAAAYIMCFIGLWKICRHFLNVSGKAFALCLIIYFFVPDNMLFFYELQPDSFMLAAFMWGLFYLFRYLEDRRQKDLSVSFGLFTISFLFLQKIIMLLFVIGCYLLFLLIKKKIAWRDIWQAVVFPVILLFSYYLYLYYTNSLNLYLLFNYELNFKMQQFMGEGTLLRDLWVTGMLPVAAGLGLRDFLRSNGSYRNFLAGIMFAGYLGLFLTGAPYCQYFIFTNLIAALIIAEYIVRHFPQAKADALLALLVMAGCCAWFARVPNRDYLNYYATHRYIMSQTTKQDPIINTVFYFFNIYGRNPSYYWFGHGNIAPVAHFLYGYDTAFDINKILREQRPKFVYKAAYPNMNLFKDNISTENYKKHLEKIWQDLPHKNEKDKTDFLKAWSSICYYIPDFNWLEKHYAPTAYYPLMIRKDLVKNAPSDHGE